MSLDALARHGLTLLFDASLKSLLILALVGLGLLLGRRSSASARHLMALLGLVSFLALPLLTLALPGWRVPLWPRRTVVLPRPVPPENVPMESRPAPSVAPTPDANIPAPVLPVIVPSPALSPTPPAAPVRSPLPWPLWLFVGWLLGVCAALLPTLAGVVAVARLGRRCRRLHDGPIAELVRDTWNGRPLTLLCGDPEDSSVVPMTWGWLRPVVLLPASAENWPPDRLRVVLLHELAHIRRGDWPCQMLAHIVCALYWFHPGAWLLARQLRLESECACDDLVLAAGVPPGDYARHLLEVIKSMNITDTALKVVLPMAQSSQVEGRLRDILATHRVRSSLSRRVGILTTLAAAGATVFLAGVQPGQSATPAKSDSPQREVVPVISGVQSVPIRVVGNTANIQRVRVRATAFVDRVYNYSPRVNRVYKNSSRYDLQILTTPTGPPKWDLLNAWVNGGVQGYSAVSPISYRKRQRVARVNCVLRQYDTYEERVTFHDLTMTKGMSNRFLLVTRPQSVTTPSGITVTLPAQSVKAFYSDGAIIFEGPAPVLLVKLHLSPDQKLNVLPNSPLFRKYQKFISLQVDSDPPGHLVSTSGDSEEPEIHLSVPDKDATHIDSLTLIIRQRVDLQRIPLQFDVPISRRPPI